jgi:hypothetical protein
MVKNYLVCAVRPISDNWMGNDSSQLYLDYQEMYRLRLASFQHFVKEPFETILWTDPATNGDTCAYQNWLDIKELWQREPCNVFWAGADTLMIRPTELFSDRFTEYRLFNYTDPKSHGDFAHHFNDDIQYYPHTMSPNVWKLGEEWLTQRETHPNRNWGFDQLRHNAMFWSQDILDSDRLHPEMAYQAIKLRSLSDQLMIDIHNEWNGIDINQAHMLHFHGSRGSQSVITIMKEICSQLGIKL